MCITTYMYVIFLDIHVHVDLSFNGLEILPFNVFKSKQERASVDYKVMWLPEYLTWGSVYNIYDIMYLPGCDKTTSNDERDSDFVFAVDSAWAAAAWAAAVFTWFFLNATYDM